MPLPPRKHALFCPYCNANGHPQPVLSPMTATDTKITLGPHCATTAFHSYRCARCGYGELHEPNGLRA